jgi:asparagine synthase (glutamine-hydrolysing)
MCGIAAIAGTGWRQEQLTAMVDAQRHRGPDARGLFIDPAGEIGLGHNRLSILDLSEAGTQPMASRDGRFWIAFNGEIYNYVELKRELSAYPYASQTDTEVILAAYEQWGPACLDRFIGMFAFVIWDAHARQLFAARDRFGVKPLVYHHASDGTIRVASEIKALHAGGVPAAFDEQTWATYFAFGVSDHTPRTFWKDVTTLPAGHALVWTRGRVRQWAWYDLADRVGPEYDRRTLDEVQEEYLALLQDSVRLRFRADVRVGINLSGGLDSSTLLGIVQAVQGPASDVTAFTFVTGEPAYDELPWVSRMLDRTRYPSVACLLQPRDVPELADSVQFYEEEPFGGLPTLAYARLFERAACEGVTVLLDGQGMDEQWAGYDYYHRDAAPHGSVSIQGARQRPVRPECLEPAFASLAQPLDIVQPFPDRLRNLQYRDVRYTKIPRALRFNDRISMRASTELREPFLDHRVVELAMKQPARHKVAGGIRKRLLRRAAARLLPAGVVEAPKRPVQTPQREWLAGALREWADECVEAALRAHGGAWFVPQAVRAEWRAFCQGGSDNSYYVWQWISLGLAVRMLRRARDVPAAAATPR